MNKLEQGRERGRRIATSVDAKNYAAEMQADFTAARQLYPSAGDMNYADAIRKFDAERLASEPSLTTFPELKGHGDLLRGEREGFREATGLDETATAFRFSWGFFLSRRMTSRHLARYDLLPAQKACTNVFFPHGADGVTISDNRDDTPRPEYAKTVPAHRPTQLLNQNRLHWIQGGVSSAVLLDDEPECLFPANPWEYDLVTDEHQADLDALIEFMTRYKDFWGPCNMIWVDRKLNAIAVEKTNCRVAFRRPTVNGAVAVTACAYLDEGLHAFQVEKTKRAAQIKGETEKDSLDLNYHLGARQRYRRLVELTNLEAARPGGATLWGALEVVADHAVPFPARVCVAGEKTFPDREPNANWSLTQHAAVITGPKKRLLYRSVQNLSNPRPVYEYQPKLALGPGVKMQPDWQADIAAGRCELVN
jgi:hypothetical protein